MKISLLFFIALLSCNNPPKKETAVTPGIFAKDCSCIKDFKSENPLNNQRYTILTNVDIESTDSGTLITGNCADVIRKYISDPKGEYETEEVTCISKAQIKLAVSDSTKFHFYVSGSEPLSNEEGRKFFFGKVIPNKKTIIQIEVEKDNDNALMISRKEYLEETK